MTPAITILKRKKVPFKLHEYQHNPNHPSFGLEAVEKLGLDARYVFKTLVCQLNDGNLAVAVIPVTSKLNLKLLAKAAGVKKCSMAEKSIVEKVTGYVLGGISPLGQKKQLTTFVDQTALPFPSLYVSAGRRGLEIEIKPDDLLKIVQGSFVPLTSD